MKPHWLVWTGLLVIGCFLLLASGSVLADTEPNDDFATAESITPGTTSGGVNETDTMDYYKFDGGNGDIVNITLDADPGAMMTFYDASETMVASAESTGDPVTYIAYTANETTVDTWYVKVNRTAENATYDLTLTVTQQDDMGTGMDAPGVSGNAWEVVGDTVTGMLAGLDTMDYYMITGGNGDIVGINLTADTSATLVFMNSTMDVVFTLMSSGGSDAGMMVMTANETPEGPWYIKVNLSDDEMADYEFTLMVGMQDDAGMGIDAPGVADNAIDVMGVDMLTGTLGDLDAMDYYMFKIGEGDSALVMLMAEPGVVLELMNSTMDVVFTLDSDAGMMLMDFVFTAYETENKTWYIGLSAKDTEMTAYMVSLGFGTQDDAGTGGDAPADPAMAMALAVGDYEGMLAGHDAEDAFKVTVNEGWTLYVNLTADVTTALTCQILNETMEVADTLSSKDNVTDEGMWVIPDDTPTDATWYLKVMWSVPEEPVEYELELGMITVIPDTEAPSITHTAPTDWQETIDMNITAVVTDNVDVTGVKLFYRVTGTTDFTETPMTLDTGDTWMATIPGGSITDAGVEYYIWATDEEGNEGMHPAGGATAPESITDIDPPPDTEAPTITHTAPKNLKDDKNAKFTVTVTDNRDVVMVTLYYKYKKDVIYLPIIMTKTEGDEYSGTIPKLLMKEGKISYYIEATDSAGNTGSYQSEADPATVKVSKTDDGPGFGLALAIAALVISLVVASRRRR